MMGRFRVRVSVCTVYKSLCLWKVLIQHECVCVCGMTFFFHKKTFLDNLNNITHYYIEADSETTSLVCFQLMTCCAVIV